MPTENIAINPKWWHWLEREDIPVVYCNFRDSGHPFDKRFRDFAKTYLRDIFIWKKRVIHVYYRQEDLDAFAPFFISQILKKTNFMKRLGNYHFSNAKKLINYSKTFPKINFSRKSSQELLKYLESFEKVYYDLALYTYIPVVGSFALQDVLEPYLLEKLKEKGKEDKFGEYFGILTFQQGKSWKRLEEEALLKISKEIKKGNSINSSHIQKLLDGHAENFCWLELGYKFLGEPLPKAYFLNKLKKIIKHGIEPLPSWKDIKIRENEIVKELGIDKKHLLLFNALRKIIYLKEFRDGIYTRSHYEVNFLIKEILRRFNIPESIGFYMKLQEYKNLLKGRKLDIPEIKNREGLFVWFCDDTEEYFAGKEAEQLIKRELGRLGPAKQDVSEIKGTIASTGKARGFAKIVKNESEIGKVNSGDILIAYMTKPSYLSAMEKAAAFVTNEGGITCHAAIVSREMKKPCLIGTKIATKVFKDGDIIEVDAERGVVRKIK